MKKCFLALVMALVVLLAAVPALAETVQAQDPVIFAGGLAFTVENGVVTAVNEVDGEAAALPEGEMVVEDTIVHTVSETGGAGVQVQAVTGSLDGAEDAPTLSIAVEEDETGAEPAELASLLAAYETLGILMDETGAFTYEGRLIRSLSDTRSMSADGEIHSTFTCLNEAGEIDVEILRDYTRTDEMGDGLLLGLNIL